MVPKILLRSEHLHSLHSGTYRIRIHLERQIAYHIAVLIILVLMHFTPLMSTVDISDTNSTKRESIVSLIRNDNLSIGQPLQKSSNSTISRLKREERVIRWDPFAIFRKKVKVQPKTEPTTARTEPPEKTNVPEFRLSNNLKNNFHFHHPELKGQSAVLLPDYKLLHSHHPGLLGNRFFYKERIFNLPTKGDQYSLNKDNLPSFPQYSSSPIWQPNPLYESSPFGSFSEEQKLDSQKGSEPQKGYKPLYPNPRIYFTSESKKKNKEIYEPKRFDFKYLDNNKFQSKSNNYNQEISQRKSKELSAVSVYPQNRHRIADIKKISGKSEIMKSRDISVVSKNFYKNPSVKRIPKESDLKNSFSMQKSKIAALENQKELERIPKANRYKGKSKGGTQHKRPSGHRSESSSRYRPDRYRYRPYGMNRYRPSNSYHNRPTSHRYRPSNTYRNRPSYSYRYRPSNSRRYKPTNSRRPSASRRYKPTKSRLSASRHSRPLSGRFYRPRSRAKTKKGYSSKKKNKWSKMWANKREEDELPVVNIEGVTSVLFALQGSNVEFSCTNEQPTKGNPVVWNKGHGERLNDSRFSVTKYGNMQIVNVQSTDSEIYICVDAKSGKEYKHVLEVYLPPEPGYEIKWQYVGQRCEDKNLPEVKRIIQTKLKENVCATGKCEVADIRVNCNVSSDNAAVLDIAAYVSGVIQNNLQCDDMECMKTKLQEHVQKAVERLKRFIALGMQLHNSDYNFVWGSLQEKRREVCPAGHGHRKGRCTPCEPGYYSESGLHCVQCEAGFYQPELGAKSCLRCPRQRTFGKPRPLDCTVGIENKFRMNRINIVLPLLVAIIFGIVLLFCCFRIVSNARSSPNNA